jgi:hypothetical protein
VELGQVQPGPGRLSGEAPGSNFGSRP